jgi:GYF domain 2
VTGLEPIWHVIIGGERRGPLTEDQVLAYLGDGTLAAGDFVWCPDFTDWKRASEIGDNRPLENVPAQVAAAPVDAAADDRDIAAHDAEQDDAGPLGEPHPTQTSLTDTAWSLWTAANVGLLVSALTLLLQIGRGDGFELASYAHTASAATVSGLIGQMLAAPLILVLIAVARNLLKHGRPESGANAARHALAFAALLACMLGGLRAYGETVFASSEFISGEARKSFIVDAYGACLRKQHAGGQNVSDPQVDKYCICISQKMAAATTYQQLGSEPDTNALTELRQKVEAVSDACR